MGFDDGMMNAAFSAGEGSAGGFSSKIAAAEGKREEGDIRMAESTLQGGLPLSFEEARALLGRLEYQRGNVEVALQVFDGIDLQAAIQRLQHSFSRKSSKKNRACNESQHSISQHTASLVLEAIYLKSMSLQKLGKATEAAQECKSVLDAVEKIFCHGRQDILMDNKLQETVSKAVEVLPELWKHARKHQEALASYRRALLGQWNLDNECCARIQKRFVVFLLYGGVEACPPSLAAQPADSFVPRNNLEEAILLLMLLLRKCYLGESKWDPSLMEHFTFALSICNQASILAKYFEEVLPGIYPRCERWYSLALCYSGAGQNKTALNLLRKVLNKHEHPNDIPALLLAAKICTEDYYLASEGIGYARRVIVNSQIINDHIVGSGLRFLGICLGKQAKIALSDQERYYLQAEALKSLDDATTLERGNTDIMFDLALEYAEQHNMNAAIQCAKKFVSATGGSILKGWRLLALVLSSQQRYSDAEAVTDAVLDETSKWDQGPLLHIKAKLRAAQSSPTDAVEQYRYLLALSQARRKSLGSYKSHTQVDNEKASEFEVWQSLANLYSSLSHWSDVKICMEKAKALRPYSAATLHTLGYMHEMRGMTPEALAAYNSALSMDLEHVPSKISLGILLWKRGFESLPVARSFLSDALRLEPTNRMAWYYLGMVHRDDGKLFEAAECFKAASMLEDFDPLESFTSTS